MSYNKRTKNMGRLRRWLRDETHFKNTNEFFTAILFEVGAPPAPITRAMAHGQFVGVVDHLRLTDWRDKLATVMSARTNHSIDPTHAVREYLKWLYQKQESGAISVR